MRPAPGAPKSGAHDPVGQWLGMLSFESLVRDHTDGGTGETRMGMEDERRDPVRAAQQPDAARRCLRELATRDSVRLAETLSAWHVSPAWTI